MSNAEIEHHLALAAGDLAAARDNLRLGHLRAAVSRAYYAMFYATTALLGSRGLWRSKHQGLIAAFGEHFVRPGLIEPRYGRILHDAFDRAIQFSATRLKRSSQLPSRERIGGKTPCSSRLRGRWQ